MLKERLITNKIIDSYIYSFIEEFYKNSKKFNSVFYKIQREALIEDTLEKSFDSTIYKFKFPALYSEMYNDHYITHEQFEIYLKIQKYILNLLEKENYLNKFLLKNYESVINLAKRGIITEKNYKFFSDYYFNFEIIIQVKDRSFFIPFEIDSENFIKILYKDHIINDEEYFLELL